MNFVKPWAYLVKKFDNFEGNKDEVLTFKLLNSFLPLNLFLQKKTVWSTSLDPKISILYRTENPESQVFVDWRLGDWTGIVRSDPFRFGPNFGHGPKLHTSNYKGVGANCLLIAVSY